MARVLVAGRIHPDGMAILRAAGLEIDLITDPGASLPPEKLAAADALLIRYGVLHAHDLDTAPRLRVVSRHGVGCDNLPVAELAARGVPVTIVGPVTAVSVAEHVLAMLLALIKRVGAYDAAVRKGNWAMRDSLSVGELAGRRLLLLGFGRIGREVARRARAFDMQVAVFDPFVTNEAIASEGCGVVSDWRAELPRADALTLHVPLSPETRSMIGAAELAALPPHAILINAARGGLVDEAALYSALTGRMAAGAAGLDCFASEPVPPDHPLLSLPNVLVSPHSAALTAEAAQRMGVVAARNVIAGLAGKLEPGLVFNRKALAEAGHGI